MDAFSLSVRADHRTVSKRAWKANDVAEVMACSPAAARGIWQRYRERGLVGPGPPQDTPSPLRDRIDRHFVKRGVVIQLITAGKQSLVSNPHGPRPIS